MAGDATRQTPQSGQTRPQRHAARTAPLVAAAGLLLFLATWADIRFHGLGHGLDQATGRWIVDHVPPAVRGFWAPQVLSFPGHDWVVIVVATAVAVWAATRRARTTAFWLLGVAFGQQLLTHGLKRLFDRARPWEVFDTAPVGAALRSLPSGHTMNSAVVYGAVLFVLWSLAQEDRLRPFPLRPWLAAWAALAGLVAAGRILALAHWPTDVVASWGLAAAWLGGAVWLHQAFKGGRFSRSPRRTARR